MTMDYQQTSIGKVPKDWKVRKVKELFDVATGTTPSTKQRKYWKGGTINWLTPTDLSKLNGRIYVAESERKITEKALKETNLTVMPKGSIIISTRAPVGYVAVLKEATTFNQGCKGLIPKNFDEICSEFYCYYLLSKKRLLENLSGGSTFKELSKRRLESLNIPFPPFPAQKKIAEILSTVNDSLQKVDESITKTERLKKGLMRKLLTEGVGHEEFKETRIGKIPKEWKVTTIDEECVIGTGGTPARNNPQYFGGNIPWVKSTEVNYNIIARTEETLTEFGLQNSNAKIYPAGSLAVALYGQGITRGRCAIFGIDAAVNQACAVIQSKGRIHIPYLFYWFQRSYSRIRSLSQGANQSNLNLTIIRSLKLPLPSLSEQQRIAEILSNVDKKLGLDRKRKEKLERIKRGLMNNLLTGRKRVKVAM